MDEKTIYDIAKKANVSASTVSRVINNYPHVKKETRAKILKILEESNFVLNETARSLSTQSTRMVGVLVADIREPYHTYAIYYVEQELVKHGYSCLIYNTGANPNFESGLDPDRCISSIQLLSQKKIDAAIMIGSLYQADVVKEAIKTYLSTIPVIMIGASLEGDNIYCILSDDRDGIAGVVKCLTDKGHRNLAFLYNHMTPSVRTKLEGFELGFKTYAKPGCGKYLCCSGATLKEMLESVTAFVKEHPDVDAIVFSDDHLAIVGLHVIYELGKKVPEDIAVVGVNNSNDAMVSNPSLTSLDNMLYDISTTATRNLFAILNGEHVSHRIVICSRLVERSST